MNIVFLDCDGVINYHSYNMENRLKDHFAPVDDNIVKKIIAFCAECNCKIVVSSSWRNDEHDLNKLKSKFKDLIIGTTMTYSDPRYKTSYSRSYEINVWLVEHLGEYDKFVVFDDEILDFKGKDVFVKTSFMTGLTDEDIIHAKKILGYIKDDD